MYDENGSPIIGYKEKELVEVFGTMNSKKRKQKHRLYLDKLEREPLYNLVDSVFNADPLYRQYMDVTTHHYQKVMKGKIALDLIKSSLLYMQKPQQQHNSYVGLLCVQILLLRKTIFSKLYGLKNNGYFNEDVIKTNLSKHQLISMGKRLSIGLESSVSTAYPQFIEALSI